MDIFENAILVGLETGERIAEFDKGATLRVQTAGQNKYLKDNVYNVLTTKEAGIDGDFIKVFRTVLGMLVQERLRDRLCVKTVRIITQL